MEPEEAIYLWDNQRGVVSNGINYFREEEGDGPLSSSPAERRSLQMAM